jgi:hypothetical protein
MPDKRIKVKSRDAFSLTGQKKIDKAHSSDACLRIDRIRVSQEAVLGHVEGQIFR